MKKRKKILSFIEILLFIAILVIHYFTEHKMGMQRYVMYKNLAFEQNYNLNIISAIIIAISLMILIKVIMDFRRKNISKRDFFVMIITIGLLFSFMIAKDNIFKLDYKIAIVILFVIVILHFIKSNIK